MKGPELPVFAPCTLLGSKRYIWPSENSLTKPQHIKKINFLCLESKGIRTPHFELTSHGSFRATVEELPVFSKRVCNAAREWMSTPSVPVFHPVKSLASPLRAYTQSGLHSDFVWLDVKFCYKMSWGRKSEKLKQRVQVLLRAAAWPSENNLWMRCLAKGSQLRLLHQSTD